MVHCGNSPGCCCRWYFTFNGVECSGPMTIDGIAYSSRPYDDAHRHRHIEGYCENISAGQSTLADALEGAVQMIVTQDFGLHLAS